MTISLWRYAHLALALIASIFILIASVTGIILAVEPISNQLKPMKSPHFEEVSLGEMLITLSEKYPEVVSVSIDENHFVLAEVIDDEGDNTQFYIDPKTAEKIGEPFQRPAVYQFSTTLHRSLFMGKIGRIIVAIVSFLLTIIVLTGIMLIVRRQQKWWRFFAKMPKDSFHPYYHSIFGRWSLFPILVVTLSGIYLSLDKFSLLPTFNAVHEIDFETLTDEPKTPITDFEPFQLSLSEVKKIEFPFSDDVEDYFTLWTIGNEMTINQFTGEILTQNDYPFSKIALYYSLLFHTGSGNWWWAVVLILVCVSLLFFMYSGFAITLKRNRSSIKNPYKKDDCEYIILVGSEGGSTLRFANSLHKALLSQDKKAFLAEMNAFSPYQKMKHLVIMTSTYGQGDAPSNADKFTSLLQKFPPTSAFQFSVVGFGSLAYAEYCKFAHTAHNALSELPLASLESDVYTINNQSFEDFSAWANQWATKRDLSLQLPTDSLTQKKRKQHQFGVIDKQIATTDEVFLISLQAKRKLKFSSGDLLGITSETDGRERLYSIGKTADNEMIISVKRHEKGLISNYLHNLEKENLLQAGIQRNSEFHLPQKSKNVIFIATGTGIGPFLGMMNDFSKGKKHLFWGGKTENSFDIYKNIIAEKQEKGMLSSVHLAFSRSGKRQYVQDLLLEQSELVANVLKSKGVIMICGSIAMQKGVVQTIDAICLQYLNKPLSYFQNKKQLRMDCY